MELVLKVGILGVIGVMVALQFKDSRPEYAYLISICICIYFFLCGMNGIKGILGTIERFDTYLGETKVYLGILLKVTGITYLSGFCQDICRDAGFSGIANQMEIFGKIAILYLALPIVYAMMDEIMAFSL